MTKSFTSSDGKPAANGSKPAAAGGKPAASGKPAAGGGKPAVAGGKPAAAGSKPTGTGGKPTAKAGKPTAGKPSPAKDAAASAGTASADTDTAAAAGTAAVARAAKMMLLGAGATVLWGIFWVVVALIFRSDTASYYVKTQHMTPAKASSQVNAGLLVTIVEVVLFVALWLWMARLNRDRQNWARIASTVFFLIWSFETYTAIRGLASYIALGNLIIMLLIWGAGLGALYYLWQPEAKAFFKPRAR